jgi:hypothetical protein
LWAVAKLWGVERSEAEAIYDSGREACVEFLIGMSDRLARVEERLAKLDRDGSRTSQNSSAAPSTDRPKTRQQRRAEAREKAKELARQEGRPKREPGAQPGHPGSGRELLAEDELSNR